MGKIDKAIEDYNYVLIFSPTDEVRANVFFNRGVLMLKIGDTKRAKMDFLEANKIDPSHKKMWSQILSKQYPEIVNELGW